MIRLLCAPQGFAVGEASQQRLCCRKAQRKSCNAIEALVDRCGVDAQTTCELRQVTHRGKTAWALDSDTTE